jgi:hypothetical protein
LLGFNVLLIFGGLEVRNSRRLLKRIPYSEEYKRWKVYYDVTFNLADERISVLLYPRSLENTLADVLQNVIVGGAEKFGAEINAKTSFEGIIKHDDHVEILVGQVTGPHFADDYEADKVERSIETYREIFGKGKA